MMKNPIVSVAQLCALLDFMEDHPQLALGRFSRGKEGRSLAKRMWQQCAQILNRVSVDCAQKSDEQWRIYYNEYKSKTLKKIKQIKVKRSATGGGSATTGVLTPLQIRLYSILGRDVGELLPSDRHIPIMEEDEVRALAQDSALERFDNNKENLNSESQEDLIEIESFSESLSDCLESNDEEPPKKTKRDPTLQKYLEKNENKLEKPENIEVSNANALMTQAAAINRLAAAIELLAERIPTLVAPPTPTTQPPSS